MRRKRKNKIVTKISNVNGKPLCLCTFYSISKNPIYIPLLTGGAALIRIIPD
jgi:protein-S-isoprenylcysteine O-methyltransferase Ste14